MRKHIPEFYYKRSAILFIYGNACVLCGFVYRGNHVHHIDGNKNNNCAFNLVPLCVDCHKLTHRTKVTIDVNQFHDLFPDLRKLNKLM
jgi:5-methylcytosine-specific restriction endonuclease McrA